MTTATFVRFPLLVSILWVLSLVFRVSGLTIPSNTIGDGVPLKILPIGDSITYGWGSTDGNGYRGKLHKMLSSGNEVEFIGEVQSGSMVENSCQCFPGSAISQIQTQTTSKLLERPNIILLMAGTSDIVFQLHADQMNITMGRFLDLIVHTCPDTVVLLSTLPPLIDRHLDEQRQHFNRKVLPGLVRPRAKQGKKIQLLDLNVEEKDINKTDEVHPTDAAYSIIADTFYQGILEVEKKDWIQAPYTVVSPQPLVRFPKARALMAELPGRFSILGLPVIVVVAVAGWRAAMVGKLLLEKDEVLHE